METTVVAKLSIQPVDRAEESDQRQTIVLSSRMSEHPVEFHPELHRESSKHRSNKAYAALGMPMEDIKCGDDETYEAHTFFNKKNNH